MIAGSLRHLRHLATMKAHKVNAATLAKISEFITGGFKAGQFLLIKQTARPSKTGTYSNCWHYEGAPLEDLWKYLVAKHNLLTGDEAWKKDLRECTWYKKKGKANTGMKKFLKHVLYKQFLEVLKRHDLGPRSTRNDRELVPPSIKQQKSADPISIAPQLVMKGYLNSKRVQSEDYERVGNLSLGDTFAVVRPMLLFCFFVCTYIILIMNCFCLACAQEFNEGTGTLSIPESEYYDRRSTAATVCFCECVSVFVGCVGWSR